MSGKMIIRKSILVCIALVILGIIYVVFIKSIPIYITNNGGGSYKITNLNTNTLVAEGDSRGFVLAPRGALLLEKNDTNGNTTQSRIYNTAFLPASLITLQDNTPETQTTSSFMYKDASFVTPLGNGYVYKNNLSQGVEYTDLISIQSISDRIGIESSVLTPNDPNFNTIVSIVPVTNDQAVLTTTKNIFTIDSTGAVTKLPLALPTVAITSVSYAAVSGKLYFINASDNTVYQYNLSQKSGAITLHKPKLLVNRIEAGNEIAVAFSDNMPSKDSGTLSYYKQNTQIEPVFINTSTGAIVDTALPKNIYPTDIKISGTDGFISYREKFSNKIHVLDFEGNIKKSMPGIGVPSPQWIGEDLYVTLSGTLWKYNPNKSDTLDPVAFAGHTISDFLVTNDSIILKRTDNLFQSTSQAYSLAVATISKLETPEFSIDYYSNGSSMLLAVRCWQGEDCIDTDSVLSIREELATAFSGVTPTLVQDTESNENYIYQITQ